MKQRAGKPRGLGDERNRLARDHGLLAIISEGHTPGIEVHLHRRPSSTRLCSFTIVRAFTAVDSAIQPDKLCPLVEKSEFFP